VIIFLYLNALRFLVSGMKKNPDFKSRRSSIFETDEEGNYIEIHKLDVKEPTPDFIKLNLKRQLEPAPILRRRLALQENERKTSESVSLVMIKEIEML
jgi:hypothetical protein